MWPLRFTADSTVPSLPNYSCREVYASVLTVPILAKRRVYVLYRSAATAQASVWRVTGAMDPGLVWLTHLWLAATAVEPADLPVWRLLCRAAVAHQRTGQRAAAGSCQV